MSNPLIEFPLIDLASLETYGRETYVNLKNTVGLLALALQALDERFDNVIATPEKSIAEATHSIGNYITLGSKLYKVTAAIAVGDSIEAGVNVEETSVAAEIKRCSDLLTGMTYSDATETIAISTSICSYANETIIFNI